MAAIPRAFLGGLILALLLRPWLAAADAGAAHPQDPFPAEIEYREWIKRNAMPMEDHNFDGKAMALKLVVTVVVSSPNPKEDPMLDAGEARYWDEVTVDGQQWHHSRGPRGSRGGGGADPAVAAVLGQLDQLLLKLPKDARRLPQQQIGDGRVDQELRSQAAVEHEPRGFPAG